jgi:hypothetical protein
MPSRVQQVPPAPEPLQPSLLAKSVGKLPSVGSRDVREALDIVERDDLLVARLQREDDSGFPPGEAAHLHARSTGDE